MEGYDSNDSSYSHSSYVINYWKDFIILTYKLLPNSGQGCCREVEVKSGARYQWGWERGDG